MLREYPALRARVCKRRNHALYSRAIACSALGFCRYISPQRCHKHARAVLCNTFRFVANGRSDEAVCVGKRKRMNVGQSRPRSPFSYEHALTALLAPARYYGQHSTVQCTHSPSLYRYCEVADTSSLTVCPLCIQSPALLSFQYSTVVQWVGPLSGLRKAWFG